MRRHALIKRRKVMGYTQEQLAEQLGIETSTISRWERGLITPLPEHCDDLTHALHVTADELVTLLDPAPSSSTPSSDRVTYALENAGAVDLFTLAELRDQIHILDADYDRAPSTSLLGRGGHLCGHINALRPHTPGRHQRELLMASTEATTLMGQLVWDATQRQDHKTAKAYFNQAIESARLARDPVSESHALLRLSFVALYGERDPVAGQSLTLQVAETAEPTSNALVGLARLHTAEAHAMQGDTAACQRALDSAETHFAKLASSDPAWHMHSPSQFDRIAGSCYLFLGDHRRAQNTLEHAADTTRPKSRVIVLTNLALAFLRQHDIDSAVAVLHRAIDLLETTRSGGGFRLLGEAIQELAAWRHQPCVQNLYDRVVWLTTT